MDFFASMLISFLDFITMIFLVFRIKNIKKILPYSLLYLLINYLIDLSGNYILMQAFIIIYFLIFCYFYSGRKPKYILYGIISYVLSVFVQFVWFSYKASSIDINSIDETTKMILTFDYFIIMGMIILAKEIYLKKRRDKKCEVHLDATTGLENSKKKATLPKN
jgi:membrane-bound ClpP family serine protease